MRLRTPQRPLAVVLSLLLMISVLSPAAVVGVSSAQTGDALYRVNGGGSTVAAVDGGADWTPPGSTTGVSVSGSPSTYSTGDTVTLDSSVPGDTPAAAFQSELYGDQQWSFDVTAGQSYEVRLYFAEIYQTADDERVFDVSIEGQQVLNDYDIHADVGHDVGTMKSYTATPGDGTLDVGFTTEVDNAKLSAIEIVPSEPQPDELGASPSGIDYGTVVVDDDATETVALTNLGDAGNASHPDISVSDVSITGADAGEFSHDFSGSTTLAPGESTDIQVTFSPSDAQAKAATLEVTHSGSNSPTTVDLTGEGSSSVPVGFGSSDLQNFGQGALTALEFGPDGRLYVAQQDGDVYALNVTRNGENSYSVVSQEQITAIKDIPNHDDNGNYVPGETSRQITGLTVGGTASQPVVYVSSSDPTIDVGTDDDDTDTNSGAISRLTFDWNGDGSLASVDHDVMVLGLPRSEENHATNGLDLSDDGTTLYVAQGGHTNKGAPGDNFGHTPEYALSAAVLSIDLAQIENDYQTKNLQNYNSNYPSAEFLYAIPTIQNDDSTDGDDLPFGGNDGVNMAKWIADGPVQVYSSGYRNPYDLVLSEDDQLYVIDNGPNGGWGGQPVNEGSSGVCTNEPNEEGSYGTGDQLHLATEGSYGGHAAPIRGNPTGADLYDANGNQIFDITQSNSPVPASEVDPVECDYQDPTEDNSIGDTFGWTGGIEEYTASNFGGEMQGDLLVVEGGSNVERVELNATGTGVTNQIDSFFTPGSALGIEATGDEGPFPGTVWTARGDITVFEPNDYGDGTGDACSGADDPTLDEDGDGYDNADEIDAGTDPCSAASMPTDFDDDGTSNLNDPDDDNDGIDDTQDLFAVDPDNGVTTSLPIQMEFTETALFGDNSQGWTGLMVNGSDYQDLYDPDQMTVGGAAQVLTVENVPEGDAVATDNTQQFAFQRGFDTAEPFTVETTVNGLPSDSGQYQSQGIYIGTGDQDNYAKLTAAGWSPGGDSGVQLAKEEAGDFTDVALPAAPTAGNTTTLTMTVYPSNGTVEGYYTVEGGSQQFVGETTVPTTWFDSTDGNGTAVGVISTSNGGAPPFDATWQNLYVEPLQEPANQPPAADAGADQTVDEGATVQLDASGSSDPDGDMLGYTWTQVSGPSADLSINDAVDPTFTAPDVSGDETLTFQVSVSDGEASDTDLVNVTVQDTDTTTGDTVFAVNAGGSEYTATDGTVYAADTNFDGGTTYSTSNWASTPPDIGNTDDDPLYRTERYGDPFSYDVPVENGSYQVTLKFAEIFQGAAPQDTVDSSGPTDGTNENDRLFNVSVEGNQVLTNYDIFAEVGALNASDETYTVEVTDGQLDLDFEATYDNAKISAIKVENATQEPVTLAETVAQVDDSGDETIEFTEMQTAVNWWQEDEPVPNTGGETIEFTEMQTLVNLWQEGATIGDGNQAPTASLSISPSDPVVGEEVTLDASGSTDPEGDSLNYSWVVDGQSVTEDAATIPYTFQTPGEHTVDVTVADTAGNVDTATETVTVPEATTGNGSAQVLVTPNSGLEASTYGGGSFQVTNTGEQTISSVTFDLSSTSLPDMVFDPDGTAGDQAGKGLSIDSESGDGVGVVSTADADVFSQPHNGVNGSDGYDVLTVEFTDFEPGETVAFSADNDPTSIKDATVSSQEAGPVSGLELARATVTVDYADGTSQTTQTIGDGSQGGSEAVADPTVPAAPNIDVQDVTLDSTVLDARHSAATVSDASQTVNVSGPPGANVTLVQVEGELELTNVPDYDGTPGYEIEAYEANKAENVAYYSATVGSDGTVDVPVTLTNSTSIGGFNYFVAAVEDGAGAGMSSNVVVLQYAPSSDTGTTEQPVYAVNAGGSAYTAVDGTEYVADSNFGGSFSGSSGTSSTDLAIGNTEDDALYQTERYGDPLSYDFPVSDGTYDVTLHFAEIWHTSETGGSGDDAGAPGEVGDRVFNVSVEGQQVLTNYDIYADIGGLNATQRTFTVDVTDGTLNLEMAASEDFAKISAIEVENASGGDTNTAPTIDAISDQTVTGGETAQVSVAASDADGDALTLSKTAGPSFVTLTDDGDGTGTLAIAPQSGAAGTYTVEVTADDGQATDTESFQLTVEASPTGTKSADLAVTPNSGIDASSYSGGSFQLTNTGEQQISSVSFDLSGSLVPDAVFDPEGTAGDSAAKGLSIDSESGDGVGVVSTADADVFSQPHDGDSDDGYDVLTVEFGDFDPGESVTFSTDIDPTTIKGASTTGGAGSISGLELAGSGVTVDYADGSSQTTDLFGDGSDGGAAAAATEGVPAAPTLGVQDVTLQSTDFPAHGAASVGDASQTLTLSGPADATVQLLQVEASEPPTDGYDLDDFEADDAEAVSYQSVTLDSNGDATVSVTLSEANLNYFVASVAEGSGNTGSTSETVILDYDSGLSTQQVLHRVNAGESTTLSATDDGPDWTGVADDGSQYLVAGDANGNGGNYCGGTITSTTSDVPSSTPDAVYDCERFGNATWEFSVNSGQSVEVRLYLGNQFDGTSEAGQRQYNASIEGTQVLNNYDPVADVGHQTGTMQNFTVTDDGDGTVTVTFEKGAVENPQVNAIEILTAEGS